MVNIKTFENFVNEEFSNDIEGNININEWVDGNISLDTLLENLNDEYSELSSINEGVVKDTSEKLYKWVLGIMKSISDKVLSLKLKSSKFFRGFFKVIDKVSKIDLSVGKYLQKFALSLMLIIVCSSTAMATAPEKNKDDMKVTLDLCNAYIAYDVDSRNMSNIENFVEAKIYFVSMRDFIQESADSITLGSDALDSLDVMNPENLSKKANEFISTTKKVIDKLYGTNKFKSLKAEGKELIDYTYNRYTGDVVIYYDDNSHQNMHTFKKHDAFTKHGKYEK